VFFTHRMVALVITWRREVRMLGRWRWMRSATLAIGLSRLWVSHQSHRATKV
jgi:hypothetical protein